MILPEDAMDTWTRYPSLISSLDKDVASLIEDYCLLSRIGDFKAAEDIWTRHLRQYRSLFVCSISHLDSVLRQTRYGSASDYLTEYRRTFIDSGDPALPKGQEMVFYVMEAYLNVFTRGWLRAAVLVARQMLEWLSATDMEDYDECQV